MRTLRLRLLPTLSTLLILAIAGGALADPAPELSARSVVVMDGWSGEILYEKDAQQPYPIASITKIMTGIIVLENADLDRVVSVPREAAETGESSTNLFEGEQLTIGTLLDMALMRSGNDAAVALAVVVGGSVAGFCDMMNAKAWELGLHNSNFRNPHGLDEEGHYQSARDVAHLARYALENPAFAAIVATPEKTIQRPGYEDGYKIKNTNQLLRIRSDCIGVKTGWTDDAGYSLSSACQEGSRRFIAVVLHSEDRFWESHALFNWVFDTYVERPVVVRGLPADEATLDDGEFPSVPVAPGETLVTTLHRDAPVPELHFRQTVFSAPVTAGQIIGEFEFEHGAKTIRVPAVAVESVRVSFRRTVAEWPNSGLLAGCGISGLLCTATLGTARRRRTGLPRSR